MERITEEIKAKMAVLDAAADKHGCAFIPCFGERYVFTMIAPYGVFYCFFKTKKRQDDVMGTHWIDRDGRVRQKLQKELART